MDNDNIRFSLSLSQKENDVICEIAESEGRSKQKQIQWIIRQFIKNKIKWYKYKDMEYILKFLGKKIVWEDDSEVDDEK